VAAGEVVPSEESRDETARTAVGLKSKRSRVRVASVRDLAKTQDPEAVKYLAAALFDQSDRVTHEAAVALAAFPGAEAADALAAALSADDEWVRLESAVALARRGDHRAIPVLESALFAEDTDQCPVAVDGLVYLGELGVAPLENLAADAAEAESLRELAISGLADIDAQRAENTLRGIAESDDNERMRRAARDALMRRGAPD
jgi:HEAT repeat protein